MNVFSRNVASGELFLITLGCHTMGMDYLVPHAWREESQTLTTIKAETPNGVDLLVSDLDHSWTLRFRYTGEEEELENVLESTFVCTIAWRYEEA